MTKPRRRKSAAETCSGADRPAGGRAPEPEAPARRNDANLEADACEEAKPSDVDEATVDEATVPETPAAEDERAFVESLVATGQAAPLDEDGKLPPGATHELVEDEEGEPKVVRRRFSIF